MNIESAKYKDYGSFKKDGIIAIIDGTRWSIPLNPDNRFYAEIMRQVEAGTLTIADAD
tara:strand:- start:220 stop:393 length:174 start_codon:yes stop_codon:yes gene_type:complete